MIHKLTKKVFWGGLVATTALPQLEKVPRLAPPTGQLVQHFLQTNFYFTTQPLTKTLKYSKQDFNL